MRYLLVKFNEKRNVDVFSSMSLILRRMCFNEVGAYGDARMSNWPHKHHTPLPRIFSLGLRWNLGECFEAGNVSAPISPLLIDICEWCDYTLPFRSLSLILVAARQLWSWPAWIVFCFFHCWVANGKHRGRGRGPALGAGWRRLLSTPAIPTLTLSCGALSKWQRRPPGPIYRRFLA